MRFKFFIIYAIFVSQRILKLKSLYSSINFSGLQINMRRLQIFAIKSITEKILFGKVCQIFVDEEEQRMKLKPDRRRVHLRLLCCLADPSHVLRHDAPISRVQ